MYPLPGWDSELARYSDEADKIWLSGKELAKPDKKLENSVFCVARFTCDSCGTIFKYSAEF